MQVAFSTVVRSAPQDAGGEVIVLDWASKAILHRAPVMASDPAIEDPNPRGNSRGGRGIAVIGDDIWVATYHSLLRFDRTLSARGRVTHPLFAGLHEVAPDGHGGVWVAATAIDAAVAVELPGGTPLADLHPRDLPGIAAAFAVEPMRIDRTVDNRLLHLNRERADNLHHLHLNAVRVIDGDVHGLFSRVGAVANLVDGRIVLHDPHLASAHPHNLCLLPDGRIAISDTYGPAVRVYRPDWTLERAIDLGASAWATSTRRRIRRREVARRALGRRHDPNVARPFFVRGLAPVDAGHVLVGISPAAVLLVDVASGRVEDQFSLTDDVRTAVHGLVTLPSV